MGKESLRRMLSIAMKEKYHILRDPYALTVAVVVPVFLVLVFGLVIDFDVRDIRLSYQDLDQTRLSRDLLQTFDRSGYFILKERARTIEEAFLTIEEGRVKAHVLIPPQTEKKQMAEETAEIQVLLDGADNSTSGVILGYLSKLNAHLNQVENQDSLHEQYLFNPSLQSSWFVVPGLSAIILALISILLTALTVAREWENGSMELLLSTPVRPKEIIIGKMVPYLVIGLLALSLVLMAALFVFSLPFTGNFLLFLLASVIFLIACLSQGMLISVVARNQQLSMQVALITGLLPSLLLSGFIFPVENMPLFFQYFTSILPARWYIEISRAIFLKGAGLFEIVQPLALLTFLSILLVTVTVKKFKINLEN